MDERIVFVDKRRQTSKEVNRYPIMIAARNSSGGSVDEVTIVADRTSARLELSQRTRQVQILFLAWNVPRQQVDM